MTKGPGLLTGCNSQAPPLTPPLTARPSSGLSGREGAGGTPPQTKAGRWGEGERRERERRGSIKRNVYGRRQKEEKGDKKKWNINI